MDIPEMSGLTLDSEDDLVVTIRIDDVVELINKFVADNKLAPNMTRIILDSVIQQSGMLQCRMQPDYYLYDEKQVMGTLKSLDLSRFPKTS